MNRLTILAAVGVCVILSPSPARPDDGARREAARAARHAMRREQYRQIREAYAARLRAYSRKDPAGAMATAAPDWRWQRRDGRTLNRDQTLAALERRLGRIQSGTWDMNVTSLGMRGDMARATVDYAFHGTAADESGAEHRLDITGRARDTWKRGPGGWTQVASQTVAETVSMDSRPARPGDSLFAP